MDVATLVGLIGAAAYLLAYALMQMRILSLSDGRYALLNIAGGAALIYSLLWNFNLGSFVTQVAWLLFTVLGYLKGRRTPEHV